MRYDHTKRALDIALSFPLVIIMTPLFVLICAAIIADSPGSPIFVQKRTGKDGRVFRCLKFRTMKRSAPRVLSKTDQPDRYITRVGRYLRKSSLDELPQFINVLAGSMSIVGPRPVALCDESLLSLRAAYGVQKIKPGITGLAQVCGRDRITPYEKAMLDLFYKNNMCFMSDARIFFHTVRNFFTGRNQGR